MNEKKHDNNQFLGEYSAKLCLTEIGLGSILHGFKIPLSGHFLSLNQGILLISCCQRLSARHYEGSLIVSNVCAVLKSLSPAGKKLGPMLSISAQGFLLSIPIGVLGFNLLSVATGMFLLSIWAFIQPVITMLFFFGSSITEAVLYYSEKVHNSLGISFQDQIYLLVSIILFKGLLSVVLGVLTFKGKITIPFYIQKLSENKSFEFNQNTEDVSNVKIVLLSIKDLFRPVFLFSFLLMIMFFYFSRGDLVQTIWYSLRPISVAFIFFFVSRHPMTFKVFGYLKRRGHFKKFFKVFDHTLEKLKK